MSGSEVARILQRIREEEESARRAMYDPAIVGKHQFITKREENVSHYVHALVEVVGSTPEAMKMFIAVQEEVAEKFTGV